LRPVRRGRASPVHAVLRPRGGLPGLRARRRGLPGPPARLDAVGVRAGLPVLRQAVRVPGPPDPERGGRREAGPVTRLTGAQALIRSLEEEGVDVIFGIPGGAILPAYDPLLESSVRHILTR